MLRRIVLLGFLTGCFSWDPSTTTTSSGTSASTGGGAGGSSVTTTAGVGASGGGGGGESTCEGFDQAWAPGAGCLLTGLGGGPALLYEFRSDFAADPGFISKWGSCPASSVSVVSGALTITDCDAGTGGAGGAGPLAVFAVTPLGSSRGCEVTATVVDVTGSAAFTLRHDFDPDGTGGQTTTAQGTIHVSIDEEPLGSVAIGVARYSGTGSVQALGTTGGFALPVRLFIANDTGERVCAGVLKNGVHVCVGCWSGDAVTTDLIDSGRVLMTTPQSVTFDDLNMP